MSTSSAPSTSSHSPAPRRATPEGRRERLRRILLDRLQAERRTYPATAGQRALWLYQQLNPGSAAYNLRFCTRVTGGLRHDDLVSAINRAMRRRPALRSRFRLVEDSLGTEVVDGLTAADTLTDGTGWSEEDIHSHLDARSMEPFDLETGPLLRVDCVRRGEDLYAMVTVHHIVADMWSLGLLLDDVLAELGAGAPAARPEDLDYSTHARAEAAWIPSGGGRTGPGPTGTSGSRDPRRRYPSPPLRDRPGGRERCGQPPSGWDGTCPRPCAGWGGSRGQRRSSSSWQPQRSSCTIARVRGILSSARHPLAVMLRAARGRPATSRRRCRSSRRWTIPSPSPTYCDACRPISPTTWSIPDSRIRRSSPGSPPTRTPVSSAPQWSWSRLPARDGHCSPSPTAARPILSSPVTSFSTPLHRARDRRIRSSSGSSSTTATSTAAPFSTTRPRFPNHSPI